MEKYLKNFKERLHQAQVGHYLQSELYHKWHFKIGIPTIILSVLSTIGVLYQVNFDKLDIISVGIIGSVVLVTIFSSLQTFLDFNQKKELHRVMAVEYGKMKREMELILLDKELQSNEKVLLQQLEGLKKKWDATAEKAPTLHKKIRVKIDNEK